AQGSEQAENLAATDFDVDRADVEAANVGSCHPPTAQLEGDGAALERIGASRASPLSRLQAALAERRPQHGPDDDGVVKLGTRLVGDNLSVPKHNHSIADRQDFIDAVGDEDDAGALGREFPHSSQQCPDLFSAESSGRFVEYEDAAAADD